MLDYHVLSLYARQRQQELLDEAARDRLADLARTRSAHRPAGMSMGRLLHRVRAFVSARRQQRLDRIQPPVWADRASV
jgi:hypothetical protein